MKSELFESRHVIFDSSSTSIDHSETESDFIYMKPGTAFIVKFDSNLLKLGEKKVHRYRMRMTGEVDLYFAWRNEGGFPQLYTLIDDALSTDASHNSQYSLKLISHGEVYPRRAYYKIVWPEKMLISNGSCGRQWKFGLWVKKDDIVLSADGAIRITAEVYYKKEYRFDKDISENPDISYSINIEEGTCDWQEMSIPITLDYDVACILIFINCENYSGIVWMSSPYFCGADKRNLIANFAPSRPYMRHLNWIGHNLSEKEWPKFEIKLNDKEVHRGELFQRIYAWPVSELDVPTDLISDGDNELSIKLTSGYRDALPFKLKKLEIVSLPANYVNIIACPEVVTVGDNFSLLISCSEPMRIIVYCNRDFINPIGRSIFFCNQGLNVVKFKTQKQGTNIDICIKSKGERQYCTIIRIVERENDKILTGSGDAIYINQNIGDMEHFLSWYMHFHLGNCITFRPVYRWSGSRTLVPEIWKRLVNLCNELGLHYCNMIDGRELPGSSANPDRKLMDGPYFMGAQLHEKDGNYWYWNSKSIERDEELYYDLWGRTAKTNITQFPSQCPIRTHNGTFPFYDPFSANSMEEAARNFVLNMAQFTQHATRHTGPSTAFKYFYQAGFNWLGAELMYNSHEVVLSALRGASRAYRKLDYGAHLAVQWSTTPHDNPQRYRRYMLALYVCYMQGVQHINTEEGLWKIEEMYSDFERFDKPCIEHRKIQCKFNRFVQTHSRRGEIHIPLAFISGKYDGWNCFGRNQVWGQKGEDWVFGPPEESWDLLKVFYPHAVLDSIYRHPCPDSPQGYYSGTPYGPVDILPIEADPDILDQYKILAFLGWNTSDNAQIEKLITFVEKGGILILGWPHIFTCTTRSEALHENTRTLSSQVIKRLIGAEFYGFNKSQIDNEDAVIGNIVTTHATPVFVDQSGDPIVIENRIGLGKVVFVNVKAYPSEKSVRNYYLQLLREAGQSILEMEKQKGWLECPSDVEFTVFDRSKTNNLRIIYFMNVNWWSEMNIPSKVNLLRKEKRIGLYVSRDNLNILTLSDNWAIWTYDNETDVIDIYEDGKNLLARIQGIGQTQFTIISSIDDIQSINIFDKDGIGIVNYEAISENQWNVCADLDGLLVLSILVT